MSNISLDRCLSFIHCQLDPAPPGVMPHNEYHPRPTVTLSRQEGSGAHAVAGALLPLLQEENPDPAARWAVFDKNLVEKVLADHHLPERLAKFMPEDRISEVGDTMDELFGLHPSSWTLVHQTAETILHLAELGHVIIIGRAANVITGKLPNVIHVRLVAPLEKRITYLQQVRNLSAKAAAEAVEREDLGRRRYLRKYFEKDVDDPLLYHLVINTGSVSYQDAAGIIAERVWRLAPVEHTAGVD